jgi:hypothetical protein
LIWRQTSPSLRNGEGPQRRNPGADDIHGDGVGIRAERLAGERGAPGRVLAPGGAIGAPGPIAAGTGGIDGGAAGQLVKLGGVGGAVGDVEGAEQRGLEGEAAIVWGGNRRRGPGPGPCAGIARRCAPGAVRAGAWVSVGSRSSESAMAETRTSVLRPQSPLSGRKALASISRVREAARPGTRKPTRC